MHGIVKISIVLITHYTRDYQQTGKVADVQPACSMQFHAGYNHSTYLTFHCIYKHKYKL